MSPRPSASLHGISFVYSSAAAPLFEGLSVQLPCGWTGVVGPNGGGKTTLLRLLTGELTPNAGRVDSPESALYCPQRTDEPPAGLDDLLEAADASACRVRGELEIDSSWSARWNSLSQGERKRSQIAVALWRDPALLAIDEPTNHLDVDTREALLGALRLYRGIGVLVSHDRHLLDELCTQCLFLDPGGPAVRPGGYSKGTAQAELERASLERRYAEAKRGEKRLGREASRRRGEAARADRERSKRRLPQRDHDAREKLDRARVSGKDAVAGKLLKQLEGRLDQARQRRQAIQISADRPLGIKWEGDRSRRNTVFSLPPGEISMGAGRVLEHPELSVRPVDRIGVTGANGTGKSTLVRHLMEVVELPSERIVYVPQELEPRREREILDSVRQVPRQQRGDLMTLVSRLGSDPARLLVTQEPSPGESRKLLLALGILQSPYIIIMDEPTNHLDLPSVECLEKALEECRCALLLVSHDREFLRRLTRTRWRFEFPTGGTRERTVVRIEAAHE